MKNINLNGTWVLADGEKNPLCQIQVPGTVLSGLLNAGKIEDPFYRTNEEQTRELFWNDYIFERSFTVEKKTFERRSDFIDLRGTRYPHRYLYQ